MLDLSPSLEQQQLIDSVGRYLADKLPIARHRKGESGGSIPDPIWRGMLDLGFIDGSGTAADEVLIFREVGRHLGPMRILATAIAAKAAAFHGDRNLQKSLLAGTTRAALAFPARNGFAGGKLETIVAIDGDQADLVVVAEDQAFFLVEAKSAQSREPLHPIDPTVDLVRLVGVPVALQVSLDATTSNRISGALLSATSAMLVGIAEATRDLAVSYAKQREQFGQPIGSFQAVKHICADMALRAEAAATASFLAALRSPENATSDVLAAQIVSAKAALQNAASCIQVHGGIGFTSECEAHLFQKRSIILDRLTGGIRVHQARLARGIGQKPA